MAMVSNHEHEHNHWFKQKRYGYGLTPTSWQGWLATLGLVALIILSAYSNNFLSETGPAYTQIARFYLDIFVLSSIFLLAMQSKTRGQMKWRWGRDEQTW